MEAGRHQFRADLPPLATAVADARYCFPEQRRDQSSQGAVRLLCAGREQCLPSFHVTRTSYPCVVTELVCEGKGKLRMGNEVCDLFPGLVYCYGLDFTHDVWADHVHPMAKYFAAYQWTQENSELRAKMIAPGEIRCTLDLSAMQTLFDELIREGRRAGELHEEITSRFLELILLKAAEAVSNDSDQRNGGMRSFERVVACIDSHFDQISGLADLSNRVALDGTYICRLFRRFSQETPNQCITRHKLNRAAELLVSQSLSIRKISEQVGYEDPFYFSRLFKKRFGYSPKQFRELTMPG